MSASHAAPSRTTVLRGESVSLAGPELKVGSKAPDFTVVDSGLKEVKLSDTAHGVRLFSVVPSLDTPVCDAQTRRFEEEAKNLPDLSIYTISMDLPFAQQRWCSSFGVDRVKMLSDHVNGSFGENYGTLIENLRIESRALFVVDKDDRLVHVEYVKEVGSHPDYESALAAARTALTGKAGA